jgi:glycerophosphoryl diester phosphodiesterase
MRQFLVRLLAFLVVILVIFGLYRLITVQPLKPSDFFAQAKKIPLVIADTGRFTQAPPYTLAALDAAQQAGADGFYLPVQLTRDGELVVLGQADLSQLTERNDPVSQLTLAEVQGLDAGYRFDPAGDGSFPWRGKGQRVLSLQEILSLFPQESIVVKVEEPGFASLAALLQAADATGSRARLLAIVDEQQLANTLRSQAPDLTTANTSAEAAAFLTTQRLRMTPFYRPAAPGLILDGDQVNRRLINSAHSRGIRVLALADGQPSDIVGQWLDAGVDGVIISDPQMIPTLSSPGQP